MKELDDLPPLLPIKKLKQYGAFMPGATKANELWRDGEIIAKKMPRGTFVTKESLVAYLNRQPRHLPDILKDLRDVL